MVTVRSRPLILLFGDSITQQGFGWGESCIGWVSLLSRDFSRRADVLNRGFSGYNTDHAVEILPNIFPPNSDETVFATVFFGANDAALPGELQHVPIETYGKNLATIVSHMRKNLKPWRDNHNCLTNIEYEYELPVILFTPPPVDIDAWLKDRGAPKGEPNDRANDTAKLYGDIVKKVGKELNCSVLDVYNLLGGNGPVEEYGKHLRDGLHLSESGNTLVYDGLINLMEKDHPHLLPMIDGEGKYGSKGGVPLEGSLWREMCSKNK